MKQLYERQYKSAYKQYDLYLLFIEKGLGLLSNKGVLVYINPIRFFNSDYGEKSRELIIKNYILHEVIDVSQISVFENAMTYPCILTIGNNTKSDDEQIAIYRKINSINDFNKIDSIETIAIKQQIIKQDDYCRIIFANEANTEIIQKVNSNSKRIDDMFNISRGLPNIKVNFQNGIYQALKSTNVKKYTINGDTPKVNTTQPEKFINKMIILPRTVFFLQATIKDENVIVLDRIYYLMEKSLIDKNFILGVINSKITNFWFEYYYSTTKVSGNYFDLNGNQIKSIPIPKSTISEESKISARVENILTLKKNDNLTDTTDLENQIDILVYKLYNLTYDEVKIIDPEIETLISREDYDAEVGGI